MKVTYGAIVQRASGRFGGTVHSNWKGIDVVRRFAKPSNPNTASQVSVRNAFRYLTASFLLQSTNVRQSWDMYVTGKPLINRNSWLGKNVAAIAGLLDLTGLSATPGDSSTIPPVSVTPVGGVATITTTIVSPPVPAGWTISECYAAACQDWDPSSLTAPTSAELQWFEQDDNTSPYVPVIAGLAAGTYRVFGFIGWMAPDGGLRYSASIDGGTVVVT